MELFVPIGQLYLKHDSFIPTCTERLLRDLARDYDLEEMIESDGRIDTPKTLGVVGCIVKKLRPDRR